MVDIENMNLECKSEVPYGLPRDVVFCKKCVMSNQRPSSTVEFTNKNQKKEVINFDAEGICSACRYHDMKWETIDWEKRQSALEHLLDRHRSKDGTYDVVVPGSGGKDSVYVADVLKRKYGMHPLTVTWPPHLYTDIGLRNFQEWLKSGFGNITYNPNGLLHRYLTREAFLNLLHVFQPFIIGQKQVGPKTALKYGIKLVMYGESQGEAGSNLAETERPTMDPKYYSLPSGQVSNVRLGSRTVSELLESGFNKGDLDFYMPAVREEIISSGVEVHHMGFYENWVSQDKFYYAVENCGFKPNPQRTEGTFSKSTSLDDKLDGFHFYTTLIKFGIGRATYEASQEIRHKHITREEAVALVHRYDDEFPSQYFQEFLDYISINEEEFWNTIEKFRSPHLWRMENKTWELRYRVE